MEKILFTYFGYAFLLSAGFYSALSWFEEKHVSDSPKETLSLWLMGSSDDTWASQFNLLFDRAFGEKHFSFKCFSRSTIASIVSVLLLFILFGPILGLLETQILDDLPLWKILFLGTIINIVPDYFSLLETRWVLRHFQNIRSNILIGLILILDLLLSAAIISIAISIWFGITGSKLLSIGEIIGAFSIYSIFFYSTFLTSFWAWLYCLTSAIMRAFSGALSNFLNVEKSPFRQLGLVSAVAIFLVMSAFKVIPNDSIQASICSLPGKSVPYHCVRTAKSAEKQLEYLTKYFNGVSFDKVNEQFDLMFLDYDLNVPKEIFLNLDELCKGNNFEGCHYAGLFLHMEYETSGDKFDAATRFEKSCSGGYYASCSYLGSMLFRGSGVDVNTQRSALLYAKACKGWDMKGCNDLAHMYLNGNAVEMDLPYAAKLFFNACNEGYMPSCTSLGTMFFTGQGVDHDIARAVSLFEKSCDQGDFDGCYNIGTVNVTDNKIASDRNTAFSYFSKACKNDHMAACFNLGVLYEKGEGVKIDLTQSLKLFQKSCEGGITRACVKFNSATSDKGRVALVYSTACDNGHNFLCLKLGVMYLKGEGVKLDKSYAHSLFDKACENGLVDACIKQ